MHPKDKVNPSLKKDIVYQWSCTKPNCKSSYIGETSRSLCEWVKEHSKEGSNSAIYQHCSTKGHPPPNIDQFKVIDQEKSQIAREAKEAIHIRKLDPELNRNVGKMVIPHVFDSLWGIKPKNPCVASLLSQEVGSQDIGINLTQFHSCVDKRVNHCSNRAQRAHRHELSNAITFIKSPKVLKRCFTPLTRLIRSSTPYSKFKPEVLGCVHTSETN